MSRKSEIHKGENENQNSQKESCLDPHTYALIAVAAIPATLLIILMGVSCVLMSLDTERENAVPEIYSYNHADTWRTKYWTKYDANSPPEKKNNNSTRINISLTRVTPAFGGCDFTLNFLLVQEWKDEGLVVKDDAKGIYFCDKYIFCSKYPHSFRTGPYFTAFLEVL